MPKRPKKLVVYLDQNFISEMSKPADRNVRPDFRALYDILHKGFWGEKFVVPRSVYHDIESSIAGDLRRPIRERQSTLGHVELESPLDIKESQVVRSVHRFLGRSDGEVIRYEDAFGDPPDARLHHIDVDVDWDRSAGVREQRQQLASELDQLRKMVHERRIPYKDQLRIEFQGERNNVLREWSARQYAAAARVTAQEFFAFVASEAFATVPIVDLEVSLMARLLTAYSNRPIKQGDATDLNAMAAYLPYCHLYGTDRATAELARSLNIPSRYDCELFDSRRAGVQSLIERLENAMSTMAPVNMPYLSIFVAPTPEVKAHSFELFFKLGNQARSAEGSWGHWVEMFGLDDGAMPRYALRGKPDVQPPFYGFQEVLPRPCEAGISGQALVEACRGLCRSTHFVIVESFKDLPDEFVLGAVWAKERGEARHLKWALHAR